LNQTPSVSVPGIKEAPEHDTQGQNADGDPG
jgi:hypothetical protein